MIERRLQAAHLVLIASAFVMAATPAETTRTKVRFLNINDRLAGEDGRAVEGVLNERDKLHPTLKGYQMWADALKPIFRELLGPPAAIDRAPPPTGDPSASRWEKRPKQRGRSGGGIMKTVLIASACNPVFWALVAFASPASAQTAGQLIPHNVKLESADYLGKRAVKITEDGQVANGEAYAVVKDAAFHNGAIERVHLSAADQRPRR